MTNLFEYQNKEELPDSFDDLEEFLDEIWKNRDKNSFYFDDSEEKIETQRFLQFFPKTRKVKSNKYVGVIHFDGKRINLLPKICFEQNSAYSDKEVGQINAHVLWWLSYCRKIKFPNYQTSLGSVKGDFFEVLIYLFSKYTQQLLSNSIYQQYEDISNELPYIKGRLNSKEYISRNVSRGRWHKLSCTYDSFVIDNGFNRAVKFVTKLLLNIASNPENKKYLRNILFILDEVSDVRVTAEECLSAKFNPIFSEFETVRDYCVLFLSNSISFSYKNDLKLFAFLLPMEYVFEDFVFGFIEKEIECVSAKSQDGSTHLDVEERFKLIPDLVLQVQDRLLIADTKYKIVYSEKSNSQGGISQSDLYQMLAYALRFGANEAILFYPNTITKDPVEGSMITVQIKDEVRKVCIRTVQLPIVDFDIVHREIDPNQSLKDLFKDMREKLIKRLEEIFRDTSLL